ncbi:MAG TPA: (d)CMP kinase [Rhabdochlamydiaceae bacterium]|nr:(d)CMP kinase [Rhabdochlamydiaceae bacterium]
MIVTIDGPAGTGKTTVAKKVAEALHFPYFDTGAMYRAVTWLLLEKQIEFSDVERIEKELSHFTFIIKGEGEDKRYIVDGQDVSQQIRSQKVTAAVSQVSALPSVRLALWKMQHEFGKKGDAVFEGRDMGTVVFPDAEVKIFLTARPEIRAQRRLNEIIEKKSSDANEMDHDKMLAEIIRRDEYDSSRTLAPLKCADDAFIIDTSDLSIDQVVNAILKYIKNKKKNT